MLEAKEVVKLDKSFLEWAKARPGTKDDQRNAILLGLVCAFHPDATVEKTLSVAAAGRLPGRYIQKNFNRIKSEIAKGGFVIEN